MQLQLLLPSLIVVVLLLLSASAFVVLGFTTPTRTATTTSYCYQSKNDQQKHSSSSRWWSPTTINTRLYSSPEPLATDGDWTAYLDDESTGLIYYFNLRTGESKWVQPTPTFPDIKLPRKLKRISERKQKEYRKAVAATKTAFSATAEAEAAAIEEQQKKQQKEQEAKKADDKKDEEKDERWFDFLSDDGGADESEAEAALATTTKKEEEEGDWFSGIFGYKEKEAESQQQAKGDEDEWFGGFFTGSGSGDDDDGSGGGKSWRISDQAKDVATSTAVAEPEEPAPAVEEKVPEEPAIIEKKKEEKVVKVVVAEPEKPPEKKKKEPPKKKVVEKKPEEEEEEEEGFFSKLFAAPATAPEVEEEKAVVPKPAPVEEKIIKKKEEKKKVIEVVPGPVVPDISAYVLPDPKKIFWGGEDAVFVKGRTFGVFDGVSGAMKLDGVPLYSKTMADQMKKTVLNNKVDELNTRDMIKYLGDAVNYCNEKATGATTAIVGSITEDGKLNVLNIGDSSCVVVRPDNGRVVARTKEINHFYECPYQFSEISPDKPRDGTKLNLKLQRGDIVVMGSDGIFDNLSEDEIVNIISNNQMKSSSVLAKRISDRSRKVSFDRKAETPFSKLALKNKNPDYPAGLGGKVDDISCVVVRYE